jgi:uncharacterized repeat protein (TIGR01451 family)
VWADTNRDGIQDDGELGIGGVELSITGPGGPVTDVFGSPVGVATTDVNGAYSFDDLPALPSGFSYMVTVDTTSPALDAYVSTIAQAGGDTTDDSSTGDELTGDLVGDGDSDTSLDFGFVVFSVSVGDFVWVDTNRDGIQDTGELGIEGVSLILTGPSGDPVTDVFGNLVGSAVTDVDGAYSFDNLPALVTGESYTVTIDVTSAPLADHVPTIAGAGGDIADDSSTGSETSGDLVGHDDRDATLDFGFVLKAVSVGDFVWADTNRDGIQDDGEPGIEGVELSITGPGGDPVTDVFGNAVGVATTDGDGLYSFDGLPALDAGESYTVTVDAGSAALDDYVATTPDVGGDPALDSSSGSAGSGDLTGDGQRDESLDFGFVLKAVSVGDFVWADINRDGIQDDGEPGIGGVELSITDPSGDPVTDVFGNLVGVTTTDGNGAYSFDNLPALAAGESYTVTLDPTTVPAGTLPTTAGAGADDTDDSSTGSAASGDLTAEGDRDASLDFGFVLRIVSVGDFVWVDTDRNGIQDALEPGIDAVRLTVAGPGGAAVTDVFGNAVGSTTTDSSGAYEFYDLPSLPAGESYTVTVDATSLALAAYVPTVASAGADTAVDSSTGSETSGDLTDDGDRDATLDFGFVLPSVSVGDFVWLDSDRDGTQDFGEPGIENVQLGLSGPNGTFVTDIYGVPVDDTFTGATGAYSFDDLPLLQPGESYRVFVVASSVDDNYAPTVPGAGADPGADSSTATATSGDLTTNGDRDATLDFGFLVRAVSVGDFVWLDSNRDGIQDDGEPGIQGVDLTITGPTGAPVNDIFGAPVGIATTDINGAYSFDDLPRLEIGEHYMVTIDETSAALATYVPTLAGSGADEADDSSTGSETSATLVAHGARDATLDFGFVAPAVSVGNFVWVDTDRDGIQGDGEPGIQGASLTIVGPDGLAVTDVFGDAVGVATTDVNGAYSFDALPALAAGESYTVSIDASSPALAGLIPTLLGAGADDSLDSSTDSAASGNLTTNDARDATLDFGFVQPMVSVGDLVWADTDRDGIQTIDESGIEGVSLTLTGPGGVAVTDVFGDAVGAAVTDGDGAYSFDGLPALAGGQSYTVTIDMTSAALAPYVPTVADAGDDGSVDSSTGSAASADLVDDSDRDDRLDFGFVLKAVSVGDFVWADDDRDGLQDDGELGIRDVTLSIAGPGGAPVTDVFGNPVGPDITDGWGAYSFDDLPVLLSGQAYTVTIVTTSPGHYSPTVAGVGSDRSEDSSTGSAASTALMTHGDRDDTLDFGFVVPMVSIGDFVWVDIDRDGVQDQDEPGIPGVSLTITELDGDPVFDVFGNPVGPATTDALGGYSFDNLAGAPAGWYTVTIDGTSTVLADYMPTVAGAGTDEAVDSSTDSETHGDLMTNGGSDTTLDFGFVPRSFDLALRKTAAADVVAPGDLVEFTITVFNQGELAAADIVVTDTLPAGLTFDPADNPGWALVDGRPTTTIAGPIAPDASTAVTILLTVADPADASADVVNSAEITTATDGNGGVRTDIDSTPDADETNDVVTDDEVDSTPTGDPADEDDHDVAVVRLFDLALRKTTDVGRVQVGDTVPFTITVYNQGRVAASQFTVTDTIPDGLTFVPADNPGWTDNGDGTASTTVLATLAPDSSASVVINLRVDAFAPELSNYAEISDVLGPDGVTVTDVDSTPDDDATDDVVVDNVTDNADGDEDDHDVASVGSPTFDLALRKSLADGQTTTVAPGDDVRFSIRVFNQGEQAATDIVITDEPPAGTTFNAAKNPGWTLVDGKPTTIIDGPLAPGSSAAVVIVLTVAANAQSGSFENNAEISAATDEFGNDAIDTDSIYQPNPSDDPVDDEIENGGGDEDAHDIAEVTVRRPVAPTSTTTTRPRTPSGGGSSSLPRTGADLLQLVGIGLALIGAGLLMRRARRLGGTPPRPIG